VIDVACATEAGWCAGREARYVDLVADRTSVRDRRRRPGQEVPARVPIKGEAEPRALRPSDAASLPALARQRRL
jgi:hypothetical protein